MRERLARLRDWYRRDTLDRELAEELAFHRRQLERDALADGATPDDARAQASRRLGNVTSVREQSRERWSWPRLDRLQQDIRYALRALRRAPGYTATVTLTLALGIGATVAMFGVIDRLMFRPLPLLREPASVHRVYLQSTVRGERRTRPAMEYARYLDFEKWTSSFSQLAAFSERPLAVGVGEAARERIVGTVSASFFDFFDARPALGRFFTREEDTTPAGADVAVLSYAYWQSQFGGRDVRGQVLQVGNVSTRIIGVAPQGFSGVNTANPPALFIPITTFAASTGTDDAKTYFSAYNWGWLNVLVRRKPGVSEAAASADLSQALLKSWNAQRATEPELAPPEVAKPAAIASGVKPWAGPDPALEARTALWLTAIAGIVLIIACANVANLALARALKRQRETAVRLALGAGRSRLVVQGITENMVLAFAAAALGLLGATWGSAAIQRMLLTNSGLPSAGPAEGTMLLADPRVLAISIAMALVTGMLTGIVPALLSGRGDLAPTLRGGARGGTHRTGLRAALLVTQGGLTVVLLVGAALFMRSLSAVRDMPMGYSAERVLRVNRIERGPAPTSDQRAALRRTLLAAAQATPEVEAASWVNSTPFISTSSTGVFVDGEDMVKTHGEITYQATTPDYFKVMSTRILRGRGLAETDRQGAVPVAVVGESMARAIWPGKEPIGQCMRVVADTMPCTVVVGVAEDMVQRDLSATQRYHFYLSIDQFTRTQGNGMLLRLRGDPAVQGETVRKALQRVMPGASYVTVQPLADIVNGAQRSWRLGATLLVAFGALALLVAAVGLYGVISYNVAQRTHELGVRIALGATPSRILRLVVGQSVRFVLVGISVGLLLAVAASRWVQPLLFRQSAIDPLLYGAVAAVMLLVAVGASASPAVHASQADPNAALRAE